MDGSNLADNLADVKRRIAAACEKAGRSPGEVSLIAVTKYAAPEQIRELIGLGVGDLGENRVQQLSQRHGSIGEFYNRKMAGGGEGLPRRLRWHMIGRLQRNKVRQLLPHVEMIHSIDSLRLAEEIDDEARRLDRQIPVLLQVNVADEAQKGGVAVGASTHLGEQIGTMPNLHMAGLMCMAEDGADEARLRFTFGRLREIFEEMKKLKIGGDKFRHLSMGMTHDFEPAIMEGSTMVRIGSALFGSHEPDDDAGDE